MSYREAGPRRSPHALRSRQGRGLRCLVPLAAVWFAALAPARAAAATVERYALRRAGVVLELSAPRADILRIRAGRERLPEDASWSVDAATRARHVPLQVGRSGRDVVLRTAAIVARLNPSTLQLRIEDAAGQLLLDDAVAPGALEFERASAAGVAAFRLRKRMPPDAHYFGLGDKAGPLDRRGGAFVLWNTDAYGFGAATDPLYKSVPFVLGVLEGGAAFGLLLDNTWRTSFDFGRSERDTLAIRADGGPVDYYVMVGSEPKAVVEAYAFLTGTTPLPPIWALGFQQSRYSYGTAAEALAVARRLRAERIPSDVIYLDIDYQQRHRPFTVSDAAFPDFEGFVASLRALDFGVVLITDPHIAEAPGESYAPYDSGTRQQVFLRAADGRPAVAEVWPGAALFPDFSRRLVRDWWGTLYGRFAAAGVAGFWNDMNEPAAFGVRDKTLPLTVRHRIEEPGFAARDAPHAEMHNVYGMLNSRATYDGLRLLRPGLRPFVLTRASFAGGQRYAATWTGDNVSSWEHLRLSTAMLLNLGLSGFGLAGDDIGGFSGAGPPPELLTRWLEVGAFNPLFRDHAGKGKPAQEPYAGPADQVAIRRRYIEARYRLLPYLYALAEEQSRTGIPMMRPVFLEFPAVLRGGERLGGTSEEFMLGPALLVAPAPEGESPQPYRVTLPGPGWYDYWSAARLAASVVDEQPQLERLPVYVRPGTILPRQPLVQSTRQRPQGPLELWVYPGPSCAGELYLDDGESDRHSEGAYLRQHLSCRTEGGATVVEIGAREGRFTPWWSGIDVVVCGLAAPPQRTLVDGAVAPSDYDAAGGAVRVHLPDVPGGVGVRIEGGTAR